MKKLLGTILLGGVLLTPISALAFTTTNDASTAKSDLSIKFEGDTIHNNDGGPFADNLALTQVPASFNFGSQKAVTGINEFPLKSGHENKQWITVNDNRPSEDKGLGKDWALTVTMDELENTTNAADKLPASLELTLDKVQEYHIGENWALNPNGDKDLVPQDPNDTGVVTDFANDRTDILFGNALASNTQQTISIPTGESTKVMNRTVGTTGVEAKKEGWATKLSGQKVKFASLTESKVAGNAYKTTLNWTLTKEIK